MQGILSFLGSGDLYMDRLAADGTSQGAILVGNAISLALNVETDNKKLISRKRATYGQTLASVTQITGSTIALTLNQMDVDTMAAVFLGDAVAMTGTGGSITTEAVTAILDKWVDLASPGGGVSTVVVKDATDTTTYVEDTDYAVNPRLGMIKALSTGAISESDVLHIDYAYAAESGKRITGATQPIVKVKLRLDGKNVEDGSDVQVNVFEALIKPSSAVDFLAEDFAEIQFEGEMLTPSGKDWPFEVI